MLIPRSLNVLQAPHFQYYLPRMKTVELFNVQKYCPIVFFSHLVALKIFKFQMEVNSLNGLPRTLLSSFLPENCLTSPLKTKSRHSN